MSKKVFSLLFLIFTTSVGFARGPDTYFEYSRQELDKLRKEKTAYQFSEEELKKWDAFMMQPFEKTPASLTLFRISTYLYIAQQEAVELSKYTKGGLAGTLDPISFKVIALFLPDLKSPDNSREDDYSNLLAEIIGKKIKARVAEENRRRVVFDVPERLQDHYFVGLMVAKWLPWYAIPSTAFWPPPPPPASDTKFWDAQIEQIKQKQKPMTEEKEKAIKLWAGMMDPVDSDWRHIANHYLFSHKIPLLKIIRVRSSLAMGLYDAIIVSFQSKYTYMVMRPSIYDPDLETVIPVPKHPSYPSNHSVTSTAAATILSYYFPENAEQWQQIAEEACNSRLWAAIHYPVDDQEGRKAGKKVAEAVLDENQIN